MNKTEPLLPDIAEIEHAVPATVKFFKEFFTAKSRHDVDATMSFFSPDLLTYTDAILGWPLNDFEAVEKMFASSMPEWKEGRSYPLRIIGGPDSALVAFVDTPELFGGELRLLGAVDFQDGKIVRWIDYWDSSAFPTEVYEAVRTPADKFPTDFKEKALGKNAAPEISAIATDIQSAFSKIDAELAGSRLAPDVVFEDFALRTQILGRAAVQRYLDRTLRLSPFGNGAQLVHIVGGAAGGGFEWKSSDGAVRGITAIELDQRGQVSRLTTTYDGRLLGPDVHAELVGLSAEAETKVHKE